MWIVVLLSPDDLQPSQQRESTFIANRMALTFHFNTVFELIYHLQRYRLEEQGHLS